MNGGHKKLARSPLQTVQVISSRRESWFWVEVLSTDTRFKKIKTALP